MKKRSKKEAKNKGVRLLMIRKQENDNRHGDFIDVLVKDCLNEKLDQSELDLLEVYKMKKKFYILKNENV